MWSYIRGSSDFINKIKSFNNIPSNSVLVTADVVGLYPSIEHESGLNAIKDALYNRERKSMPTEAILKMLEFTIKNNYFEFNRKVNSYWVQLLVLNVHHHIHIYLWCIYIYIYILSRDRFT